MRKSYVDRMYDRQHTLELRIKDAHSSAICFQSTFASYLESMNRVFQSKEYKSLPRHRKSYLRGVWDTLFHQLQNSLVWVLTGPDGVRYGPGNDAWLEQDHAYKSAIQGMHVWPVAWAKGEYRPFGAGEESVQ